MSKYNDFMSHIRVDGDTHRRVMDAVSKALDEQTASVSEQHISYEDVLKRADEYNKAHGVKAAETTPIRRKAKLSAIQILSIAAAAILVSGVLYVAIKNGSRKSATTENLMQVDNAAETTAAEATSVNQGIKSAVGNDRDSLTAQSRKTPRPELKLIRLNLKRRSTKTKTKTILQVITRSRRTSGTLFRSR